MSSTKTTKKKKPPFTKVRNVPNLWRYKSGSYHRIQKVGGKMVKEKLSEDLDIAKRKLSQLTKESAIRGTKEIKFSELCDLFLKTKQGNKAGTVRNYKWVIKRFENESAIWNTPVHKITPIDFQTFIAGLRINPRGNNLFSDITKMILEVAVINDYITDNPILRVRKIIRKKVIKSPQSIPTDEEAIKIIENIEQARGAKNKVFADLLRMIYFAGLGEAEAKKMQWEEIDWSGERINVQRQKTGKFFYVPFYPWLKTWLVKFWKDQGSPNNGQIFAISVLCRCLTRSCERLQLPVFTAKAFRKACIVRLLSHGMDYRLVAKYQGHTDNGQLIVSTYSNIISSSETEREKKELEKLLPQPTSKARQS